MLRVLVAMNPTPEAARLLTWTYAWIQRQSAPVEVTVLHVVPVQAMGEMGVEDAMASMDLDAAREKLAELTKDAPVPLDVLVRAGNPGPVICQVAEGYDQVVIGKHAPGLSDFLLGSTSEYVARNAPCPVALVDREG